jgi:hypothetical protein
MEPALTAHTPLLVNTVGHSVGALVFGLSLYFLARQRFGRRKRWLPMVAAGLALVWNVASLVAMAAREEAWLGLGGWVAVSTSALSVLPAVLLHLSLGGRFGVLVGAGYVLSGITVLMHMTEHVLMTHRQALWVTTIGFAGLTVVAVVARLRGRGRDLPPRGLLGAMALFLFALSLVHVDAGEAHESWSVELVAHHAGVPLALVVLLQDVRFVLLDAFLRVLTSLLLAGAAIGVASRWVELGMPEHPMRTGLLLVGVSVGLALFAQLNGWVQGLFTRLLFGRPDFERTARRLQSLCGQAQEENELVAAGMREIAAFLNAELREGELEAEVRERLLFPLPVAELPGGARARLEEMGVEVVVPVRLGGETRVAMLGARRGGRRYLSEDLQAAERLAVQVAEHVEHFRETEMRRLVAEAELRALESQIHPHFLFNALNTLYGVIPREATGARRTVLNLADVLRYFLRAGQRYIRLEEELRIVEAYLEIEKLRLGERLRTRIEVEEAAKAKMIPVLSLQPLVENAVKHAIATQAEGGEVRVRAWVEWGELALRVEDTGPGFGGSRATGQGVGLQNVRKRLRLCYGAEADLEIESAPGATRVEFRVPADKLVGGCGS